MPQGHPNLCASGIDRGLGIGRQGGYAESVVVPAGMLRPLPVTVSSADAALTEPLAVAIRAIRISAAAPGEPVCVLGACPLGMLAAAVLRARGFARVAVVEPPPPAATRPGGCGRPGGVAGRGCRQD